MSVWFTSDLHIGHRLVAQHRGFDSVEDHDKWLAYQWRQAPIRKDDVVWVLGDLSVSSPDNALALIREWPGRKQLIAGNHDACHPMHRKSHVAQRQYLEVFESVQAFARRKVSGRDVLLSHFPYLTDRGPTRYLQYRLRDEGAWLLHGHTHGPERLHGREIHVGMDAWGGPVSLDSIAALIEGAAS